MSKERKPCNNQTRIIDPCGVDGEGNLCWMTGFDKPAGIFWGKPKNPNEDRNSEENLKEKKKQV